MIVGSATDLDFPSQKGNAFVGWLEKKGKGESFMGRQNWKRRYFILEGDKLSYFDKMEDKNPIKTIPIRNSDSVEVIDVQDKKRLHCFRLITYRRTLYVSCSSSESSRAWQIKIKLAISQARDYLLSEK